MKEERFGNLVFIPGHNEGRYPYCNSLFIDDDVRAIIDPGSDAERLSAINSERPFRIIINSHYHEDHFAFNYLFPDADLYVHAGDAPGFSSTQRILEFYGVYGTGNEAYWRGYIIKNFNYRERVPARQLADGDILDFGRTKLEVVHSPGHTPGHLCFYSAEEGVLFLTDLDMTPFGPYYGDAVSDIDATITSVRRLMRYGADVYITSHEAGIIKGDITKLVRSYLSVIDEREEKLLKFLNRPRMIDEIVSQWIIYKKPREPKEFFLFIEDAMIKKHLSRLMKNGQIDIADGRYFLI